MIFVCVGTIFVLFVLYFLSRLVSGLGFKILLFQSMCLLFLFYCKFWTLIRIVNNKKGAYHQW